MQAVIEAKVQGEEIQKMIQSMKQVGLVLWSGRMGSVDMPHFYFHCNLRWPSHFGLG